MQGIVSLGEIISGRRTTPALRTRWPDQQRGQGSAGFPPPVLLRGGRAVRRANSWSATWPTRGDRRSPPWCGGTAPLAGRLPGVLANHHDAEDAFSGHHSLCRRGPRSVVPRERSPTGSTACVRRPTARAPWRPPPRRANGHVHPSRTRAARRNCARAGPPARQEVTRLRTVSRAGGASAT